MFLNYNKDLELDNFKTGSLDLQIQRVNNDTYLKVFQNNLFPTPAMPSDKNLMVTKLNYDFDHENYNLTTGFESYEKLGVKHTDRYQYILPKYSFTKSVDIKNLDGSINFIQLEAIILRIQTI